MDVFTVVETPLYSRKAGRLLTDDEREEIAAMVSLNPTAGSPARGSGGVRKLRWAPFGIGKSGGTRVLYYNRLQQGEIWLLALYPRNETATIPAQELRLVKEAIERDRQAEYEYRGR